MKRPYCYPYKGKRIGYGYIKRGRKEARNAYRECRKNKKLYGASFDNSELWNLDVTFCNFIHTSEINKSEYIKSIIKSETEEYVRKKYSINVVSVLKGEEVITSIDPEMPFTENMKLIVIADTAKLEKLK
jgi:K+/H+ antiporter YhaU regulatory subunit KhtT